jgi:tetratricopeptide (TPR) repeat protein
VQLVEAETTRILWTQKFDRSLSELADLQEDLVTEVAAHLGVQVQKSEMERALKKPDDITAYEAVQRSWAIFGNLRMDTLPVAIAEARRAISIAPDYGEAWAVLAVSLAVHYFWTGRVEESLKREALDSVRRSLSLAPNDVSVLSRAGATFTFLDQPREGLSHSERALALNPSAATAHAYKGIVCLKLGRNDEAIAANEAYERLAPGGLVLYSILSRTACAHVQAGRLEQAVEVLERSLRLNPDYWLTLIPQAGLCDMVGRHEEAADAVRRLRMLEPGTSVDVYAKRYLAIVDPVSSAPLIAAFRKVWDETPTE